jgi:pyruvate/2-oxoglutarate dehydrogenase complex dihydrolipoamide dehydrogenase (E3) component
MKRYNKPGHYDRNLIVIGAGSAGLVSAYIGAVVKARVTLIEKNKMGGDCLYTGCVPSKALIRTARIIAMARRAQEFGLNRIEVDFDFSTIMERVDRIIRTIEPHDSVERYSKMGVECIKGAANISTPYAVEVNGTIITSKNIIIATGAKPFIPPIPGIDKIAYYTSDTIWEMRELPKRLAVLGGGPIGAELSQCFARLGSAVTQIEMLPHILYREDPDVSEFITEHLRLDGVRILANHTVTSISVNNGEKYLICEHGGSETSVEFDELLVAVGRKPNTGGLGLENLDIACNESGGITTNRYLQTTCPNIFACGDVTGTYQFTHTAAHQAWYAAVNSLFGGIKKFKVDYSVIPWATFTDPEIARVGLNETEAINKNIPHEVTRYAIDDLDRAIVDDEARGFVKVLTTRGKDEILGATIISENAGELITEFISAMRNGFGLNRILGTIHIYPTMAEANKYAAGVWKRKHAPQYLLNLAERYHKWRRGNDTNKISTRS